MRSRQMALVGVVMAALAASCGTPTEPGDAGSVSEGAAVDVEPVNEPSHPGPIAPAEGPYDTEAEIRPDLMEIHPDEVSPGEWVELRFPEETLRGVGFVLEEWVEDSWEVRFFLTPSRSEPSEPPADPEAKGLWLPPDNPAQLEWSAEGVVGPAGFALIPGPASPGEYRICTATNSANFCEELTITG